MPIHFSPERWDSVRKNCADWWDGKLNRALVKIVVTDAFEAERAVKAPVLSQANVHDFSHSPEDLVEAWDAHLGRFEFLGDSFPYIDFDKFGPGVLSAFCGARLDNATGDVWFFPREYKPLKEIHVTYDPNNPWARRIKRLYEAGIRKWGNMVCMGMPDLGGVLDIAAVFRGTEDLLMDLYDDPDGVLRLCAEIERAWFEAYQDFSGVLRSGGIGYTDWSGIYSDEPSYTTQCDFAYMIGRDMFAEFALPTLRRDCDRLPHVMYHLDGVGQIAHLDDLLAIDRLKAVQWVYGEGHPTGKHWMEIYRKIKAAGKQLQIYGGLDDLAAVSAQIPDGVYYMAEINHRQRLRDEPLMRELGLI